MDRRNFLERAIVAASAAVVSPLARIAALDASREDDYRIESSASFPTSIQSRVKRNLQDDLARGFVCPPESAAPWVYWMWINVDTTPDAMTFDLEQMKAMGIAGFILYNTP